MAATRQGRMPASTADRDRAIRLLQDSFIEGRLAVDEFKERVGQALVSLDFRELLMLTADLPVRGPFDRLPAHRLTPRRRAHGIRSQVWLVRIISELKQVRRFMTGRGRARET
jgi:Domain of unknown function (DUF1707)